MSKRIWWALVLVAIVAFVYRVRVVLTPFLFAIIMAYILHPLVLLVEARGASRTAAILIVYLFLGVLVGVTLWSVLPKLLNELEAIVHKLPEQAKEWEEMGQDALSSLREMDLPATVRDGFKIIMERVEIAIENFAGKFMQLILGVFANVLSLIISPVLAFYLLRDHRVMKRRTLQYVPAKHRGHVQNIMKSINEALNGFFRGQLLVCLFVGVFIYVGLYFLKIPYALFIGLLAGLFDIIPYFGPILGFIPAAAFAFLKSPLTVLWVLFLFVAANQIENGLISPKVIGDRAGLHPLVVIFAVFVGGDLLGIVGMLLAIPVASTIRVILEYFLLRKPDTEHYD